MGAGIGAGRPSAGVIPTESLSGGQGFGNQSPPPHTPMGSRVGLPHSESCVRIQLHPVLGSVGVKEKVNGSPSPNAQFLVAGRASSTRSSLVSMAIMSALSSALSCFSSVLTSLISALTSLISALTSSIRLFCLASLARISSWSLASLA